MVAGDRGQGKATSGVARAKWIQGTAPTLEHNREKLGMYKNGGRWL